MEWVYRFLVNPIDFIPVKTHVTKECSLFDKLIIECNELLIVALVLPVVTQGAKTPINSPLAPVSFNEQFLDQVQVYYKSSRGIILDMLLVHLVCRMNYIFAVFEAH